MKKLPRAFVTFVRLVGVTAMALWLSTGPALAARVSLQAYFQEALKDTAYQKNVYQAVAASYVTPAEKALPAVGRKCVVQATIGKDGKLAAAFVSTTSGSAAFDEAALAAVKKPKGFGAFPSAYKLPALEVHFHFGVAP